MKIIDLRGPVPQAAAPGQPVLLAAEVVHNVALQRRGCETRWHAAEHLLATHQRQTARLQIEVATAEQQLSATRERHAKLDRVVQMLDEMRALLENDSLRSFAETMRLVQALLKQLATTFSPEERAQLQFAQTLVPTLLGAAVQTALDAWNPLLPGDSPDLAASSALMRAVLLLNDTTEPMADMNQIRKAMLMQYLIPKLTLVLESSRWDPPTDHAETALMLYELLDSMLRHAANSSAGNLNDDDDEKLANNELSRLVRKELVHTVVYRKLSRALSQTWKPRVDGTGGLVDRPDLWILPWLPHLAKDAASIVPALVADCKRTVKHAVAFLQRAVPADDERFVTACIQSLRPWRGIFKVDTIQGIVSSSVTPRLARYLAKCPVEVGESSVDQRSSTAIDFLFRMHSLGLMSDLEFASLLEGELLPRWADAMHQWIAAARAENRDITKLVAAACETYAAWKFRVFGRNCENDVNSFASSFRLLRSDVSICACFYGVLRMVVAGAAPAGNGTAGVSLETLGLSPRAANYRTVLARRRAQAKRDAADDLLRMAESGVADGIRDTNGIEARVRLHHNNRQGRVPTFRDVVEEYAREHDILFQPRMGHSAAVDGKQIFLFGTVPIYLDANVAFASVGSGEWLPMSLSAIAKKAVA